jgi:acyl-CoA dehydrogenase
MGPHRLGRRRPARHDWEELLAKARKLADKAGHYRFALPKAFGGQDGSNLWMAVIREHLASKGLGLFNDLQNEHSIVGNNPFVLMIRDFGREDQQHLITDMLDKGAFRPTFGLTEPDHGSDATFMETRAVRETHKGESGWRINGEKMWTTGMHAATHCCLFARTSGEDGDAKGITAFLVPAHAPGVKIEEYLWTFNMPTDHPRVSFTNVFVPDSAMFAPGGPGPGPGPALRAREPHPPGGLQPGGGGVLHRRERQVRPGRKPFGKALAENQAIQFPLVELASTAEMLRLLIRKTAWEMDQMTKPEVEKRLSDKVSMCNYQANRLVCDAADRAMQVHGGIGYSRHKPFEHIYRHHRRYRITEGSEEIQIRKVAAWLFGYLGPRRKTFAEMEKV